MPESTDPLVHRNKHHDRNQPFPSKLQRQQPRDLQFALARLDRPRRVSQRLARVPAHLPEPDHLVLQQGVPEKVEIMRQKGNAGHPSVACDPLAHRVLAHHLGLFPRIVPRILVVLEELDPVFLFQQTGTLDVV